MNEKRIEEYLRERVKSIGGRAYKWTSPGNNGVPDRIVIIPEGKIHFVELKKPRGGKTAALQKLQQKRLLELGVNVWQIHTKEQVENFIKEVGK